MRHSHCGLHLTLWWIYRNSAFIDDVHNLSESGSVGNGTKAIFSSSSWNNVETFELTTMFLADEGSKHFIYQIINVKDFHLYTAVVNLNWEIIGNIVTEGSNGTIIIRTTPLTEKVWEAVDEHFGPYFPSVLEKEVFTSFLATTIFRIAKTTSEGSLGRAREHHGTAVFMCLQCVKQDAGKTEIALHELFLILWTVDTGKVENKISFSTKAVKFFLGITKVILEDFIYLYTFVPASLAFPDVIELRAKIFTDKTFCPCNQNLHLFYLARLKIPFNSF